MQITIREIGNSLGGIFPKNMLKSLDLKKGDKVDITEDNGCLVIEPVKITEYSLEELLAQCDGVSLELNQEDKSWIGSAPVGKEIL